MTKHQALRVACPRERNAQQPPKITATSHATTTQQTSAKALAYAFLERNKQRNDDEKNAVALTRKRECFDGGFVARVAGDNAPQIAQFQGPIIQATAPEHPPAIASLVSEYVATFRRTSYLSGRELREATEQLVRLGRNIDRLAPGFDWPAIWEREGALLAADPSAAWSDDAREAIAWLESLDVATVPPFIIAPEWPVPYPANLLMKLRAGIAQGPGGPHARQVMADLLRVMAAAKAAIASGQRLSPAQVIHGTGPTTRAAIALEWDKETTRRLVWLKTLTLENLPKAPFRFGAVDVADAGLWLARMKTDAAAGPGGPRARSGALQADVARLELMIGEME